MSKKFFCSPADLILISIKISFKHKHLGAGLVLEQRESGDLEIKSMTKLLNTYVLLPKASEEILLEPGILLFQLRIMQLLIECIFDNDT